MAAGTWISFRPASHFPLFPIPYSIPPLPFPFPFPISPIIPPHPDLTPREIRLPIFNMAPDRPIGPTGNPDLAEVKQFSSWLDLRFADSLRPGFSRSSKVGNHGHDHTSAVHRSLVTYPATMKYYPGIFHSSTFFPLDSSFVFHTDS